MPRCVSSLGVLCVVLAAPRRARSRQTRSASARRAWAARSPPSPTMRRRRGGIRPAWPAAPTSTAFSKRQSPRAALRPHPERRSAASRCATRRRSFAVAFPALGLSYYRFGSVKYSRKPLQVQPPASDKRGERRTSACAPLVLNQFGATVGQSLGSHLVVGSTFKVVSGGAVSQIRSAANGSLDAATDLDPSRETHASLDVGAMAVLGRVADGGDGAQRQRSRVRRAAVEPFTLQRQARVGVGVDVGAARRDRQRHARRSTPT